MNANSPRNSVLDRVNFSSSGFGNCMRRLKLAFGIESDQQLAMLIHMTPAAFHLRCARESIPRRRIDALIAEEGINPSWVYEGEGPLLDPAEKPRSNAHELSRREALRLLSELRSHVATGSQDWTDEELRDIALLRLKKALLQAISLMRIDDVVAGTEPREFAELRRNQQLVMGGFFRS